MKRSSDFNDLDITKENYFRQGYQTAMNDLKAIFVVHQLKNSKLTPMQVLLEWEKSVAMAQQEMDHSSLN